MGKDIHMYICEKGKVVKSDIFNGRCSCWFDNMSEKGEYDEYNHLPIVYGWNEGTVPKKLKNEYPKEDGYFDFYHVKVGYFKEWFKKYRPDIDAGWATKYEAWAIEHKGYRPGYLPKELDENANINDNIFVEYERCDDCSKWLYNYLNDNKIKDNAFIVYCFDC